MESLELQKFDKGKAELTKLANGYKGLKIKDVNDDFGYEQVKKAKNELVHERGILEKLGKSMRDNFTKVNREIMKKQKDVVGIVQPIELDLKAKLKAIDEDSIKAIACSKSSITFSVLKSNSNIIGKNSLCFLMES